ncbi:uncharacterized protein LOC129219278 [Uloborus diversus]|uniref:uncharacterized protein LOC129219278 n=1 Tax=Uloborus diversus TaxID=327109 RepID=UPI0024094EA7|nr:uncharacterized protein LOC129219278 [Uloborus diversus]
MDAIKRASFASKQIKAGLAPLASFEDLPSDELESPEEVRVCARSSLEIESISQDLQFHTPDSLTYSSQSTPRVESDFDSQYTLTPGDPYHGQSSSDLRTTSLSSLSKESTALSAKQKKGSAVSLGTYESSELEYSQRKTSWTDIFKNHDQNTSKSTNSVPAVNEKTIKKKSRSSDVSKDSLETKSKEKGKFLSIFKKKSSKNINSPVSSDTFILPNENLTECVQIPENVLQPKLNNGSVFKGKENELPEPEFCPTITEVQNDLGKVNSECSKTTDNHQISHKQRNISEKSFEKEYNILSKVDGKQVDQLSKTENIKAIVEEFLESSESELTFESKEIVEEKKEDDFEAEILLPHDLSEIEEDPVMESRAFTFEVSKHVVLPTRQERLKITTKPIDRPRSTTPINVAPLEAFIQSVSPTFDPKVEKIKLSLPGEQFTGRDKSPKKSSIKSWADFCERGLHSPRMHNKTDRDEQKSPFDTLDGAYDVPYFTSNDNWAAFESNFKSSELNRFGDNFTVSENIKSDSSAMQVSDNYVHFETNFQIITCSCECHINGCSSCGDSNLFEPESIKGELNMQRCCCQCHNRKS